MIYDINGSILSSGASDSIMDLSVIGKKIITGEIKRISLIGDSITAGAAGTGYNGTLNASLSTNTAGYCWANMLKAYLGAKYGTVVTNYGQYGSNIGQQIAQFSTTLANADLVIWLTGTNNRNDASLDVYKSSLKNAIDTIKATVPNLIVMSCPPSTKNEDNKHTHKTWEVAGLIYSIAIEKDCKFLHMHDEMNQWWLEHETPISELTPTDSFNKWWDGYGIHPKDAGYHIMLMIILHKLGIPVPFYEDLTVNGDYYPFS